MCVLEYIRFVFMSCLVCRHAMEVERSLFRGSDGGNSLDHLTREERGGTHKTAYPKRCVNTFIFHFKTVVTLTALCQYLQSKRAPPTLWTTHMWPRDPYSCQYKSLRETDSLRQRSEHYHGSETTSLDHPLR